jgi:hypothetical protein
MTVTDDRGHHVQVYGDADCAGRWCAEHSAWHVDTDEGDKS